MGEVKRWCAYRLSGFRRKILYGSICLAQWPAGPSGCTCRSQPGGNTLLSGLCPPPHWERHTKARKKPGNQQWLTGLQQYHFIVMHKRDKSLTWFHWLGAVGASPPSSSWPRSWCEGWGWTGRNTRGEGGMVSQRATSENKSTKVAPFKGIQSVV